MNPWMLVTKYRIRPCSCRHRSYLNEKGVRTKCHAWFIDDMYGDIGISGTYTSWDAALDTVIRSQTRQYYASLVGNHDDA